MTSARTERDTLGGWDEEWDESDGRADELMSRFGDGLAERDAGVAAELEESAANGADSEASWLRAPAGEEAKTIFEAVQAAGDAEQVTFTDKAVIRERVVDMMTRGIADNAETAEDPRAADLATGGMRLMDRGLAMGAPEVFYRGIADVRAGQRRAESDGAGLTDVETVQERGDRFQTEWDALVKDHRVAAGLSIADDRALSRTLAAAKDLFDEVSQGLSVDDQYALASQIAGQFTAEGAGRAASIATGESNQGEGGTDLAGARRIAAGVIAENIREASEELAEALVHVDRRLTHEAGREAAWALEDLADLEAGRQVSTAAFEGNREADRQYTELWVRGRSTA